MEVTLSVLATPPLPVLEQIFITSSNRTALWDQKRLPGLRCRSYERAEQLQCSLDHECECLPAESQVVCKCKDDEIMNTYQSIDNVLPATREQVRFLAHPRHGVMTKINQDVSAEIIVNVKEAIDDSITEVTDDICTIENTHLVGCYQCSKGATTAVKCTSTFQAVTAEIECGEDSFTVPCSPSGQISQLAFLMENARVQMQCTVKCGSRVNFFEVTGILKYVHKLHGNPMVYVQQKHNKTSEFRWPDVNHIVDIYLQWYKSLLCTVAVVALALLLTYMYVTTACGRIMRFFLCIIARILACVWKTVQCMSSFLVRRVCLSSNGTMKEKGLEKLL
ncbi:unnamed protein product [Nippostrongylus brasiliensis]|uniref:Phlebovirus_G2 domain-containing protein n=1 Tax=Nippostrongylus brasiliensis TaxID=27835 RepID=A0A0N4YZ49_NIPBR|nr:unnamed protein product [Nippostrongylus brasiliensis]